MVDVGNIDVLVVSIPAQWWLSNVVQGTEPLGLTAGPWQVEDDL